MVTHSRLLSSVMTAAAFYPVNNIIMTAVPPCPAGLSLVALNSRLLFAIRALDPAPGIGRSDRPYYRGAPQVPPFSKPLFHQRFSMSSTFDTVAKIIAETCDIAPETITPESHAINDLGIDSLDFLDIAFAIDKAFGIKLPLEQWTQEVNDGKATTEQYFVMKNLCARIDDLVAAKGA